MKNQINIKVYKYGLYNSANDVFVHILSHIENRFRQSIQVRIISKKYDKEEIDSFIDDEVIMPLWESCQESSLITDLQDLYGLMYLLAGNCHIDWDEL